MKKLYLLLMLLVFVSITNVSATVEVCTPSDEYLEYMKLSDEERKNVIEPMYCKEIIEQETKDANDFLQKIVETVGAPTYPAAYSAVEAGLVTPPKDQYGTNLCWNFSGVSAIETNALKNGLSQYDFSEAHLTYSIVGNYYNTDDGKSNKYYLGPAGGKIIYTPSYFLGDYGQLLENQMDFSSKLNQNKSDLVSVSSNPSGTRLISIKDFIYDNVGSCSSNTQCQSCQTNEKNRIKELIMENGSVQATIYIDPSFNGDYWIAPNNITLSNHAVTIVGWDDNISKDNFSGADQKGAWIVKNSWGPTWSNDGYFYISYGDRLICKNVASYSGVELNTFDNVYSASKIVGDTPLYFSGTVYMTAKFDKKTSTNLREILNRVTIPVGNNMSYTVYLSKSNIITNKARTEIVDTDWEELYSGRSDRYGFVSEDLDTLSLSNRRITGSFTIIVKYEIDEDKSTGMFITCKNDEVFKNITIPSKKNYINFSSSWSDFKNFETSTTPPTPFTDCIPDIYAYTNNEASGFTPPVTPPTEQTASISLKSGSKFKISSTDVIVTVGKNEKFTYSNLVNGLDITPSNYSIYNAEGNKVSNSSDIIGTGSEIRVGDLKYKVVVVGDANSDGTINSGDLLRIVKYLKKNTTLTNSQLLAADSNRDNKVDSGDLLRIVKYLKGNANITV